MSSAGDGDPRFRALGVHPLRVLLAVATIAVAAACDGDTFAPGGGAPAGGAGGSAGLGGSAASGAARLGEGGGTTVDEDTAAGADRGGWNISLLLGVVGRVGSTESVARWSPDDDLGNVPCTEEHHVYCFEAEPL